MNKFENCLVFKSHTISIYRFVLQVHEYHKNSITIKKNKILKENNYILSLTMKIPVHHTFNRVIMSHNQIKSSILIKPNNSSTDCSRWVEHTILLDDKLQDSIVDTQHLDMFSVFDSIDNIHKEWYLREEQIQLPNRWQSPRLSQHYKQHLQFRILFQMTRTCLSLKKRRLWWSINSTSEKHLFFFSIVLFSQSERKNTMNDGIRKVTKVFVNVFTLANIFQMTNNKAFNICQHRRNNSTSTCSPSQFS